jgi:hypothetical protein
MPESVDDFLKHHGVPGMKWGKRKAKDEHSSVSSGSGGSSGGSSSGGHGGGSNAASSKPAKPAKPTSDDIRAARARQTARAEKIGQHEVEFFMARTHVGEQKALGAMRLAEKEYIHHPDAKVASMMTKGEKIANGITLGALGAMTLGSVAMAVASNSRMNRQNSGR